MTGNDSRGEMNENIGCIKGEICNRDGCCGIIEEHEKEGCCSCHINPPCSYCTTDTSYCPECNWEPSEDIITIDPEVEKMNQEFYQKERDNFQVKRELFYQRFNGKEPIVNLEMRTESHTHFTQKVIGVFPAGTETVSSILPKVMGTFGGRFTRFGAYNFEYIAYTD